MTVPTLAEVRAWANVPATVLPDAILQQVLTAELMLQARLCTLPLPYPDELAQALLRRVQRHIAARNLPLGLTAEGYEYGPARLPRYDQEIERLEAPHRAVVLA